MPIAVFFAVVLNGVLSGVAAASPPPPLPPAPPTCVGEESEGEYCRIGLSVAPCASASGECLNFDKPWFGAIVNFWCVPRGEQSLSNTYYVQTCLHLSAGMQTFVQLTEWPGIGATLTTTYQQQKADEQLPFSNAPASDADNYIGIAPNTTLHLLKQYTLAWKSSVGLYWINGSFFEEGAHNARKPGLAAL